MSKSVETTIRTHLQANDAAQETIEWAEIVARREADIPLVTPPRRSYLTGVWVAVAAAVVTILLFGFIPFLVNTEKTPPANTAVPTSLADSAPTTNANSVESTVVADGLAFDELLDSGRMATSSAIVVGPDGLPVIWYWSEDPEVFFGDAVGPSGLRIIRCADAACGDYEVIDASHDLSALPPAGFFPDGAPVFVEAGSFPGATEGTGMVSGLAELHVCTDANCSDVESTVLETVDYPDLILNVPQVLIGESGLPVLIFQSDAPPAVNSIKVMACEDRACTTATVTTLADEAWGPQAYVSETGGLVVLYRDLENGWLALTCALLDCSDGATAVAVDDAVSLVPGGLTPVWWGGGPDDEGLEVCLGPTCIAIGVLADGEGPYGYAVVMDSDGLPLVVYLANTNHGPGRLLVSKCVDASCNDHTTVEVAGPLVSEADLALGRFHHGEVSVVIGDSGLPLIAYGTIDGLHLIRCADPACNPPNN